MSRAGRNERGTEGASERASGHYGKSGGKSPLPKSKDELWPPELVPECPTERERERVGENEHAHSNQRNRPPSTEIGESPLILIYFSSRLSGK